MEYDIYKQPYVNNKPNNFCIFTSALDYMETNLCNVFTQNDVATACYCSLSTLQKMWRYCTHTSLKEYISKRRLSRAASDLVNTDMTVLDIAMKYQYNSHEVFTRAFTKQWNISPSRFKSEWNNRCELFPKLNKDYYEGADFMGNKKFDVSELFDYLNDRIGTYVLCLDIVGLMTINTNIGREAGDKTILEAMRRINSAAGEDMLVFRIGGDEFVMITGLDNKDEVTKIAETILSQNGNETAYSGGKVSVSLRAGAVTIKKPLKYTGLYSDFDEVINKARDNGSLYFI